MHYTPPLHTQFIGQRIIYEATCASTNTTATQCLHKEQLPEGTVFITDHQYQGRGQRGHSWYSEPHQNLTFSVVLYPTFLMASQGFSLNIVTALALRQTLAIYMPNGLTTKWPNDLYFQDKKLSGVLTENTVEQQTIKASIVGIGLNINQMHFDIAGPTSLARICGHSFDLQSILAELLTALEQNYVRLQMEGVEQLKVDYLKSMYWIGEVHTFQDATCKFQGEIRGIDALGRLMIELTSGTTKHYDVKEVAFLA